MIKHGCFLLLLFCLYACHSDALTSVDAGDIKTFITTDTLPEIRDSISKSPVAAYTSSKGDKLTVTVYQTQQMFQFIMKMKYKFLNEPDTLRIPNFGIQPKIAIQEGADQQSCIVGFLDNTPANNKPATANLLLRTADNVEQMINTFP